MLEFIQTYNNEFVTTGEGSGRWIEKCGLILVGKGRGPGQGNHSTCIPGVFAGDGSGQPSISLLMVVQQAKAMTG